VIRKTITAWTVAVSLAWAPFPCPAADPALPLPLKVVGKQLHTSDGRVIKLTGVNIPSLEWGQGEHLLESLNVAVGQWGANVIRLPLSQDRWFGHSPERKDGGTAYRRIVRRFVEQAAAKKCYVILDLHWSDCDRWGQYIGQHQMPDDHSAEFWASVAAAYRNHPAILFGLYNEPFHVSWNVWRDGGDVIEPNRRAPGGKLAYRTPGLQKLLDICRDQGARNLAVVGGLDWAYDLSGLTKGFALTDPKGNGILYDTHIYPWKKDWDRWVTPAVERYAVIVGEFGVERRGPPADPRAWLSEIFRYIDKHKLNWTAWCLHPAATPNLIRNWRYELTKPFGEMVERQLVAAQQRQERP